MSININGFNATPLVPSLHLQPNGAFTREALGEDINLRQSLINQNYLAALLNDPRVVLDEEHNRVAVTLEGSVGPRVNVTIKDYALSEKTQVELLPIKREGNIDPSAIVEGGRRIRNRLQEEGYFFAEVNAICTVDTAVPDLGPNGTKDTCDNLNPESLTGHTVNIDYQIDRGRPLSSHRHQDHRH